MAVRSMDYSRCTEKCGQCLVCRCCAARWRIKHSSTISTEHSISASHEDRKDAYTARLPLLRSAATDADDAMTLTYTINASLVEANEWLTRSCYLKGNEHVCVNSELVTSLA